MKMKVATQEQGNQSTSTAQGGANMSESINLQISVSERQLAMLVECAEVFDELHGLLDVLKAPRPPRTLDQSPPRGQAYHRHRNRDVFVHPQSDWV